MLKILKRIFKKEVKINSQDINESQLELFWNNKYPKKPIIYGGRTIPKRDGMISIDVRKMFWSKDYMLENVIGKEKLIGSTWDRTALNCQQYIVKHYKYEYDINSVGFNEYWQFPNETLHLKMGDCEDGSLLMASLMVSAGVPEWRVRLNAGWALDQDDIKQGHAYVTYCRSTDNNWCILDWCYREDSQIAIKDKIMAKNNSKYLDIWFSFNSLFSFSHKNYDLFEGIYEEPKIIS